MTRPERLLWLQILGVVLCCLLLAWLIGAPSGWTTADVLRDRILMGVNR